MEIRGRIKRVIKFSHAREEKQQIICSAIRQLRPIEFYYLGGYRTVEPFALGIVLTDRRDNLSLLCWQIGGSSDLLDTVGWKLYRVSDMEDIDILKEHFTGERPGYEPQNLEMARVICCVPQASKVMEEVAPAPPPEIKVEAAPVVPYEPPPPPPTPRTIVRVLSHNELMERFRYAHPPTPELEAMLWEEPLVRPFPEPVKPSPEAAAAPVREPPKPIIWLENPERIYMHHYLANQTA